ncbi:MAG: InlB B-repeat-containing protein [Clostridia bacterium]|nr:InlB B-repeat-containing protein [Clostridia bacterium]
MKKRYLAIFFVILLASAVMLSSCGETLEYYTVTFDLNGGNTASAAQDRAVEKGKTTAEPPAPIKEGHTFLGWYNGEVKWNFDTDTVVGDLDLKAKWELNTYTVIFDSDGGSEVSDATVDYGNFVTEPDEPAKVDHAFLGWYYGETKWNFDSNSVTANITLKAKWRSLVHTVTFDSAGGSTVPPVTVMEGELLTKPENPSKESSVFLGWYNGNEEWNFDTDTVMNDMTLTAKWNTTITVAFDSNGGGARDSVLLDTPGLITEPFSPSREGQKFLGWYNGEVLWNFETDVASENITLTAHWEACETYTITFNSNGGSEVETYYVPAGETIPTPPSPTKNSCKLLWWEYYSEEDEEWLSWSFSSNVPTQDMTLVAYWSLPIHRPT